MKFRNGQIKGTQSGNLQEEKTPSCEKGEADKAEGVKEISYRMALC